MNYYQQYRRIIVIEKKEDSFNLVKEKSFLFTEESLYLFSHLPLGKDLIYQNLIPKTFGPQTLLTHVLKTWSIPLEKRS
jgi:hypothetical protein